MSYYSLLARSIIPLSYLRVTFASFLIYLPLASLHTLSPLHPPTKPFPPPPPFLRNTPAGLTPFSCPTCSLPSPSGVPISRPIAGVAMGLLLDEEGGGGEPIILTDILGSEDALGTMDFKVAGDAEGITAFQLDIKCEGLSLELMGKALQQAKLG